MQQAIRVIALSGMLACLSLQPAAAEEGSNQGHNSDAGPARMLQLFPQQGLDHLDEEAWEHGAPHVINNVTKDARSAKSGNAPQK